ncbi:MAG: hypothetical protein HOQ24_12825 [Mycobacteriaceae bacterium]|nr:hypothetical protein [Mycobacteriaceae bacterium]
MGILTAIVFSGVGIASADTARPGQICTRPNARTTDNRGRPMQCLPNTVGNHSLVWQYR